MHQIITISRAFGSGGRELGKRLAETLGIAYYDREILSALSEKSGLAEQYLENITERGVSAYYPITCGRTFSYRPAVPQPQIQVLVQQHKLLQELAAKSGCVIVGRCADVVLRDLHPLRLFVHASLDSRIRRCQGRQPADQPMSDRELEKRIARIDRDRAGSRRLLTDAKWGDAASYDLCINTTGLEIPRLIPAVASFAACYFEGEHT